VSQLVCRFAQGLREVTEPSHLCIPFWNASLLPQSWETSELSGSVSPWSRPQCLLICRATVKQQRQRPIVHRTCWQTQGYQCCSFWYPQSSNHLKAACPESPVQGGEMDPAWSSCPHWNTTNWLPFSILLFKTFIKIISSNSSCQDLGEQHVA
jgi:hypothetical protein